MFCPFAVNATVERGARPRSRDGGFLTAAWRPFLGTPFSLSPLRWVVLLPPTLRSPAQCRARSRCSPDTCEADGNPACPRARASERLCAADAGRGRPRGVRGPRVGSRASRRWGLHGRRMHSFLQPDDAAFIPQRRSPSLPPTQLPCFSRSNSITWRPPTCCSLGPGTARSWCSRKTRRSCWPKKASPCPPSFPSPRWVGGALGPGGLLPAAARPWISPLGLPR